MIQFSTSMDLVVVILLLVVLVRFGLERFLMGASETEISLYC